MQGRILAQESIESNSPPEVSLHQSSFLSAILFITYLAKAYRDIRAPLGPCDSHSRQIPTDDPSPYHYNNAAILFKRRKQHSPGSGAPAFVL